MCQRVTLMVTLLTTREWMLNYIHNITLCICAVYSENLRDTTVTRDRPQPLFQKERQRHQRWGNQLTQTQSWPTISTKSGGRDSVGEKEGIPLHILRHTPRAGADWSKKLEGRKKNLPVHSPQEGRHTGNRRLQSNGAEPGAPGAQNRTEKQISWEDNWHGELWWWNS